MREFWSRLSTVAKVGLIGAVLGFAGGMAAVVIADPKFGVFTAGGAI